MEEIRISCIVHTFNSASSVREALQSVKWVDELIVVDMESTDDTLAIAGQFTQNIHITQKVPRIDAIRNVYIDKASGPWILILDSDEYLSEDAKEQTTGLILQNGSQYDAFALPRFNYIAGNVMQGNGWYPDHQIRLFRKGTVQWKDATHMPPEVLSGPRRLLKLAPPQCLHIHHNNYRDLPHFIEKQVFYALNDRYPADPDSFDFNRYAAKAFEQLAMRTDATRDGDLSRALAILMAWDAIVRGLIHWDHAMPRPFLGDSFALPVMTTSKPYSNDGGDIDRLYGGRNIPLAVEERLHRLDAIESSLSWIIVQKVTRLIDDTLFPWDTSRGRLYRRTVQFLSDTYISKFKKKISRLRNQRRQMY